MTTLHTKSTAQGISLQASIDNGKRVSISTCFTSARAARSWGQQRIRFVNRIVRRTYAVGRKLTWRERLALV